jgi:hypothetical protein
VQGLNGQALRIANNFNKIGGHLKSWSDANNLEVEVPLGVWDVETGLFGGGYGPDGRLTIRLENHVLWDLWVDLPFRSGKITEGERDRRDAEFDKYFRFKTIVRSDGTRDRTTGHEIRSSTSCPIGPSDWTNIHATGTVVDQPIQHDALKLASCVTQDDSIAYRPVSMGGPQIMGNEYTRLGGGYTSAKDMYDYFQALEHLQIVGFFDFSRSKGVLQYVEKSRTTKDWTNFANFYNGVTTRGPEYQAAYDVAKQLSLP